MSTEAIIAIDPSLTNTAIYVAVRGELFSKCFGSKSCGTNVAERIPRYTNQIADVRSFLASATSYFDAAVYIEGYSMGSRAGMITGLCEYGGLLRAMLLSFTDRIIEVPPATLKKFATGTGKGPKDMVAAHITKRYGVLLNSNDEYDAYGLLRLGMVAEGWEEPANQGQREAVESALGLKPKARKKRAS